MKKKLLIILGAGSSIPLRLPSVADLDAQMAIWARDWNQGGRRDYYSDLHDSIDEYYKSRVVTSYPRITFEKVLGEMLALSRWVTPSPWGDTLRQAVCGHGPPSALFPTTHDYGTTNDINDINAQIGYLKSRLAAHMRSCCQSLGSDCKVFSDYSSIFRALRNSFDAGVSNLNYDTAALTAMPAPFCQGCGMKMAWPGAVNRLNY